MKIAILGLRGMPSSYSGYETFIHELAPRLVERGHEVTVYCRSSLFSEQPADYRGVKLVYLPSIEHKAFSTLSHTLLAITHASLGSARLIFVVNAANGMFGWIPRMFGKKAVLNVDGMEWLRPKWGRLARWVFKNSARWGCRFYQSIVTDADEMHRIYAREFGIHSTYIAYGARIERSEHPEFLAEYGLEAGTYYLAAGRLVPDNNADLIIQGYLASGSQKILAIAGSADYRGNEKEQAYFAKLKKMANGQIRFLGHVGKPGHFKELHCHCYAYIHGHEYGGLNPSLLQALGYGNCILALNTPFSREALMDGKYGQFYLKTPESLAQNLRQIDQSPERADHFRRLAPERVRVDFSWEKITSQYETLFASLS